MTAVDGHWLAELGPMFYSVKEANISREEKRKQTQQDMNDMEEQMKVAEEELRRRKEESERVPASKRCELFSP